MLYGETVLKDYTEFIWLENYKMNRCRRKIEDNRLHRTILKQAPRLQDFNFCLNNERHYIQNESDDHTDLHEILKRYSGPEYD